MIRKTLGGEHLLIPQDEHALLSGRIAEHFGNDRFAPPEPRASVLRAISLHDCGWPEHDESPTLNDCGLPRDVFESTLPIGLRSWAAAGERVEAEDPYTRLLVSLHVLGLSAYAAPHAHTPRDVFELNRFQHAEIERQVDLRRLLGLSTNLPLNFGLAVNATDPGEIALSRNHLLLQFADRLSLALCCTKLPFPEVENVTPAPGQRPLVFHLARPDATAVAVAPWPFDAPALELEVSCRFLPERSYASLEEFRTQYAAAPQRRLALRISPQ